VTTEALGAALLVLVFGGIFAFVSVAIGWRGALVAFAFSFVTTGLLVTAVFMIMGPA
jgi:hypothetical protein